MAVNLAIIRYTTEGRRYHSNIDQYPPNESKEFRSLQPLYCRRVELMTLLCRLECESIAVFLGEQGLEKKGYVAKCHTCKQPESVYCRH